MHFFLETPWCVSFSWLLHRAIQCRWSNPKQKKTVIGVLTFRYSSGDPNGPRQPKLPIPDHSLRCSHDISKQSYTGPNKKWAVIIILQTFLISNQTENKKRDESARHITPIGFADNVITLKLEKIHNDGTRCITVQERWMLCYNHDLHYPAVAGVIDCPIYYSFPSDGMSYVCATSGNPILPWTLDSFTVSLHSPNGRHLPAVRAVQRGLSVAFGKRCGQVSPKSLETEAFPNLYSDRSIINRWFQPIGCHVSYPTDNPAATRRGLFINLHGHQHVHLRYHFLSLILDSFIMDVE